ncbi:predicted protein [Fibroporia radiculosa]|uniref:Uncharacterized protein n=1 Tax=Fibroporia radiculosa TaxID=599839 RepID=J4GIZ7_9APHY|nr:predicted protein [Fibroporia radiculosa]
MLVFPIILVQESKTA